jgi:hypothetical protein
MKIRRLRRTALALLAVAGLSLAPAARAETSPTVPLAHSFRPLLQQIWELLAGLLGPVDTADGVQGDMPHTEGSGIDPDGGRRP